MKKLSILFAAMVAMVATSCVQANVEDVNIAEEGLVTLTVNAPSIGSRAINDGMGATTLTYAIYDKDWKFINKEVVENAFDASLTKEISLRLVKNKEYYFVFWAQNPSANCYAITLGDVQGEVVVPTIDVTYGGKSNDDTRDAFFGNDHFTVDGNVNRTVELTRPFAQINFATEDTEEALYAGYNVPAASTSFKTYAYTSLNLADGSVGGLQEVAFTAEVNPEETLVLLDGSKSYDWLAMNYILVPEHEDGTSLSTCEMTVSLDGQSDITISYPNAPAKRNWRTNLVGNLLTEQAVIEVVIKPIPMEEYVADIKDGLLVSTAQDFVAAVAAAEARQAQGERGPCLRC